MKDKIYYHATAESNATNIIREGIIHKGIDDIVYVCENPEEAYRFVALRVFGTEDIYVFEIHVPENVEVEETFDHSYSFFQCKAFGISQDIPMDWCSDNMIKFDSRQIFTKK